MMRVILLLILVAPPLWAQDDLPGFPALHDVRGVAADDVLNIRAEPSAASAIMGTLAPDARGVEVVGLRGGWYVVNAAEGTGYVNPTFLAAEDAPDWRALSTPLSCFGTEPFWGLSFAPAKGKATLNLFGEAARDMAVTALWPALPWAPQAGVGLDGGTAVMRGQVCSDGMSDRTYGIAVDLFLSGPAPARYSGCCSLVFR